MKISEMTDIELEQAVLDEIMPAKYRTRYHGWRPQKAPFIDNVLKRMWKLGWEIGQCSGQTYQAGNKNSPFRHWSVWLTKGTTRVNSTSTTDHQRPILESVLKAIRKEAKNE